MNVRLVVLKTVQCLGSSLLLLVMSVDCIAQNTDVKPLTLHSPVESHITPRSPDTYSIDLESGQFASVRVNQIQIGLTMLVYDPAHNLIDIVDENGIGHEEVVTIDAQQTGRYTITVQWNYNLPLTGSYQIELERIEVTGKTPVEKAQQLFHSWYNTDEPGAVAAVIQNNHVIFKEVEGLANLEEQTPLSNTSIFEMASVSKQFTAFAIAMLIDSGQLSLDDDIRTYLPEMPDYGEKITIANLVYHTSGIRSTDIWELTGFSPEDRITLPMILKFATDQQALKFSPGEMFNYSNTNYNLLAEIITRVTGQPFSSWTRENIFLPLGMNTTFFKDDPGQVYFHKVLSYTPENDAFVQRLNNYAATGSAGLNTTIDDLVKWVESYDSKQLITDKMETLLNTTGTLNDGSKTHYAFGIEIGDYSGHKSMEHLGLVIGYRTAMVRFPQEHLSIIYMSNDDNDATYQRYFKLRDLFLPDVVKEKPSIEDMPNVDTVLEDIRASESKNVNENLAEYSGTFYSDELHSLLDMVIRDNELVIVRSPMSDIKLTYTDNDNFGFVQFARDMTGQISSLKILGENLNFVKVD